MKRLKFDLGGGLGPGDLEQIHAEVLQVLSSVGLQCGHERTLEAVSAQPGAGVRDGRILLSEGLVEEHIERLRCHRDDVPPGDEVTVSGPWNCLNIIDMETDEIRPSTGADSREMFKLVHAAAAGGICPVYPNDLPPRLQVLFLEKTGIELAGSHGSALEFKDDEMVEAAVAMHSAAGGRYHMVVQFPISPLRLDDLGLETIWRYMGRNDVELCPSACPIPLAGLTAPLFAPAALVQAAAEGIGSHIVAQIISGGRLRSGPGFRLDIADMRYMNAVYSSPDHILFQLLLKDVYAYYHGRPKRGHFLQTNAKRPDAQAVLERTSYMLTLALAGYRRFSLGAGQLSMDEVFSPAMFIIDREMARFVGHIIKGIAYDDRPDLSLRVISEAIASPDGFVVHESTIEHLGDLFESDLMPRYGLQKYLAEGSPDLNRKAVEKAKNLIAGHSYSVPGKVQEELDRIWREAEGRAPG